jgi:hypothetical protein
VLLNAPLLILVSFPGAVGLKRVSTSNRLVLARSSRPATSGCVDVDGMAPMGAYLTGRACAPRGFPYQPVLRQTKAGPRMTDPEGNCTAAVGDTGRSFDFSAACDSHDYAYDLLRFFGAGGDARRTADAMFGEELFAACGGRSVLTRFNCYGWAAAFDWLNKGNALLRRYQAPLGVIGDATNAADLSGKAGQVLFVGDLLLVAEVLRRRRRRQTTERVVLVDALAAD